MDVCVSMYANTFLTHIVIFVKDLATLAADVAAQRECVYTAPLPPMALIAQTTPSARTVKLIQHRHHNVQSVCVNGKCYAFGKRNVSASRRPDAKYLPSGCIQE